MFKLHHILILLIVSYSAVSCSSLQTSSETQPEESAEETQTEEAVEEKSNFAQFEELAISRGEFKDKILMSWKADETMNENPDEADEITPVSYHIYRSTKDDQPYEKIAEVTDATEYTDTTVEPGLKAYYRILRVEPVEQTEELAPDLSTSDKKETDATDKTSSKSGDESFEIDDTVDPEKLIATPEKDDTIHENFGYIKCPQPKTRSFSRISRGFTKGKSALSTDEQNTIAQKEKNGLKKRTQHPVQLNMILTMSQPYISDGTLKLFTDFDSYTWNKDNQTFYLFDKDHSHVVVFYSRWLHFFAQRDSFSLSERMLYNSVAFSRYKEDMEVVDENGYSRILPAYETVALATWYYPKYRDWKQETIIILTSDKKLQKELQNARN